MNPMKKFLAILLGATVLLGATIAFADDSATEDDSDEVSVEQVHDADQLEAESEEVGSGAAEAPGQLVARGDEWTSEYARGLAVATLARGEAPAGMEAATNAGSAATTTDAVHGKSDEHKPADSEG